MPHPASAAGTLPAPALGGASMHGWRDLAWARGRKLGLVFLAGYILVRLLDAPVFLAAHDPAYDRKGLHAVLWAFGRMETWTILGLAVLLTLGLEIGRRSRTPSPLDDLGPRAMALVARARATIAGMLASGLLAGAAAELAKRLIGRERPRVAIIDGQQALELPYKPFLSGLADPSNLGLPSSHAAVVAGCGLVLAARVPALRAPMVVLVAAVCAQRVAQGAHVPSDVYVGAMIAVPIAWWVLRRLTELDPVLPPAREQEQRA